MASATDTGVNEMGDANSGTPRRTGLMGRLKDTGRKLKDTIKGKGGSAGTVSSPAPAESGDPAAEFDGTAAGGDVDEGTQATDAPLQQPEEVHGGNIADLPQKSQAEGATNGIDTTPVLRGTADEHIASAEIPPDAAVSRPEAEGEGDGTAPNAPGDQSQQEVENTGRHASGIVNGDAIEGHQSTLEEAPTSDKESTDKSAPSDVAVGSDRADEDTTPQIVAVDKNAKADADVKAANNYYADLADKWEGGRGGKEDVAEGTPQPSSLSGVTRLPETPALAVTDQVQALKDATLAKLGLGGNDNTGVDASGKSLSSQVKQTFTVLTSTVSTNFGMGGSSVGSKKQVQGNDANEAGVPPADSSVLPSDAKPEGEADKEAIGSGVVS